MTQTTTEPGVLARLSSTITVEEAPGNLGYISIVRERYPHRSDAIVTLRGDAEDKLLAFLLARKGITLQS